MIIKRLLVLSLLAVLGAATPAYADRIVKPGGKIILTPETQLSQTYFVAGDWAGEQWTLWRRNKTVWVSPLVNRFLSLGQASGEYKGQQLFYADKLDLNGDGKPDWLYLQFSARYEPPSSTLKRGIVSFPSQGNVADRMPLHNMLCGWVAGFIVLDDLKTVYAFDYSLPQNPLGHSALRVLGPERVKNIWQPKGDERELRATSPMPPKIWKAVYDLVRQKACPTIDPDLEEQRSLEKQIQPNPPQTTFNYDWRLYLPPALKMYRAAVETYKSALKEIDEYVEKDLRPSKRDNALGLFRFTSFFKAIPYDVVDPQNKYPEYTAMLNDYAYYLYASSVDEIRENQRKHDPYEYWTNATLSERVIPYLQHVIKRDPRRVAAYLNLADAQWELPDTKQAARQTYRRYIEVLKLGIPNAKPAKRAVERAA